MNRHLSEIISLILEPIANAANGADVDSTGDLLCELDKLNDELSKKLKVVGQNHVGANLFSCEYGGSEAPNPSTALKCDGANVCNNKPVKSNKSLSFGREMKSLRVKNLRKMRVRKSCLPNIKAKMWAARIIDELEGFETMKLPSSDVDKKCVMRD